jgi:hypothetical protein
MADASRIDEMHTCDNVHLVPTQTPICLKALKDRAVQKQVVFNRNISPSLCSIPPPKLMLPHLPRHWVRAMVVRERAQKHPFLRRQAFVVVNNRLLLQMVSSRVVTVEFEM